MASASGRTEIQTSANVTPSARLCVVGSPGALFKALADDREITVGFQARMEALAIELSGLIHRFPNGVAQPG